MTFCFLFLSYPSMSKCSQKWNASKVFNLADSHLYSALDGNFAPDGVELQVMLRLGELQGLQRIAIPQTDTHWVIMLVDAKKLSEIMVYKRIYAHNYETFEEVEDRLGKDS